MSCPVVPTTALRTALEVGVHLLDDAEAVDSATGGADRWRRSRCRPDVSGDGGQRAVAPAQVRRHLWSRSYSAAEYLARLSTYSGHRAASADQRQQLFADVGRMIAARPGGCVRKHYLNVLEVARR
jgi:hypothetical protein